VANSKWGAIAVVVAACGLAAGFAILGECSTQRGLETFAGDAVDAVFAGDALLLIDHVEVTHKRGAVGAQANRVIALDVATGKQLGTHVFDQAVVQTDRLQCWPGANGHVPCLEGDKLYILELAALDKTIAVADLAKSLGRTVDRRFSLSATDLIVALDDGRGARVDLATLAVSATTGNGTSVHDSVIASSARCASHATVSVGAKTIGFVDGPLAAVVPIDPHAVTDPFGYGPSAGKPAKLAEVPADAARFLKPAFLDLGAVPPVFVYHRAKLDARTSDPAKLTRLDDKLHVLWTADVGGDCQVARLDHGTIVIAGTSPKLRAVAVDAATGAVKWTFHY
jgi:hypothetical protein